MFKIINSKEVISQIEKDVEECLPEVVLIFPELKNEIIKKMLWGIFSENSPEKFFTMTQNSDESHRHYERLLNISYSYIEEARQSLIASGEETTNFFSDSVEKSFNRKDLEILLDYENCDVKIAVSEDVKKPIRQNFEATVALTLPDSESVFSDLIQGNLFEGEKNTWLLPYMDMYDEWKYKFMDALYLYTFQVGGHGRWIQSNYNDVYVAQANIDIGDCGSVFLRVRDGKFAGYVDMY